MLERLQYTFRGEGPVAAIPTPNGEMMQSMVRWDPSTEARFSSMQTVYKNFQNKPILGYGVTGFTFIDAQYHRVLIETGLIGLFAFYFFSGKQAVTCFEYGRFIDRTRYTIFSLPGHSAPSSAFYSMQSERIHSSLFASWSHSGASWDCAPPFRSSNKLPRKNHRAMIQNTRNRYPFRDCEINGNNTRNRDSLRLEIGFSTVFTSPLRSICAIFMVKSRFSCISV